MVYESCGSGLFCEGALCGGSGLFCEGALSDGSGLFCEGALSDGSGLFCEGALSDGSGLFCEGALSDGSGLCGGSGLYRNNIYFSPSSHISKLVTAHTGQKDELPFLLSLDGKFSHSHAPR